MQQIFIRLGAHTWPGGGETASGGTAERRGAPRLGRQRAGPARFCSSAFPWLLQLPVHHLSSLSRLALPSVTRFRRADPHWPFFGRGPAPRAGHGEWGSEERERGACSGLGGGGGGEGGGEGGGAGPAGGSGRDRTGVMVQVPGARAELPGWGAPGPGSAALPRLSRRRAAGREDAEQVDERQQQEPGARVQLHRAAAGRQRVHLHHPGQCRAALPAGPPRTLSLANLAPGRRPGSPQTPVLCPSLAAADGPGAERLRPRLSPGRGTGRTAQLRWVPPSRTPAPSLPSPRARAPYLGYSSLPGWGASSAGVRREAGRAGGSYPGRPVGGRRLRLSGQARTAGRRFLSLVGRIMLNVITTHPSPAFVSQSSQKVEVNAQPVRSGLWKRDQPSGFSRLGPPLPPFAPQISLC